MNFDLKQIVSATVVLFAIIDILGSIPIILNIRKKGVKINPLVVSSFAFGILMLFLFFGDFILQLFNVDIESFAVAGSLVIFVFALEMLLDIEIFRNNGPTGTASFIPIAFPLVAGPGSFTTLLSLRAEYHIELPIIGHRSSANWEVTAKTSTMNRIPGYTSSLPVCWADCWPCLHRVYGPLSR